MVKTHMQYISEMVGVLAEKYGMSDMQIAEAIGAGETTVKNWRHEKCNARPEWASRLEFLLEDCQKYGPPEKKRAGRYRVLRKGA